MAKMSQAQIFASCTHRDYFTYNQYTEEFEYQSGYDENSMFKINTNLTMFEHTTPDISSTYYVSKSEFDESTGTLSLEVVSDVGNEYHYTFDIDDDEIRVIYKRDGDIKLLRFTVKKFWKVDE